MTRRRRLETREAALRLRRTRHCSRGHFLYILYPLLLRHTIVVLSVFPRASLQECKRMGSRRTLAMFEALAESDGRFTVTTVNCLDECGMGPNVQVGDDEGRLATFSALRKEAPTFPSRANNARVGSTTRSPGPPMSPRLVPVHSCRTHRQWRQDRGRRQERGRQVARREMNPEGCHKSYHAIRYEPAHSIVLLPSVARGYVAPLRIPTVLRPS